MPEKKLPKVAIIEEGVDFGFYRANNIGFRYCLEKKWIIFYSSTEIQKFSRILFQTCILLKASLIICLNILIITAILRKINFTTSELSKKYIHLF
jgi:hypothetical protein